MQMLTTLSQNISKILANCLSPLITGSNTPQATTQKTNMEPQTEGHPGNVNPTSIDSDYQVGVLLLPRSFSQFMKTHGVG